MAERWTDFAMTDIPRDVRLVLSDRARRQTVERYQAPVQMFEQAEAMVAAGYVQLTMRNQGMVYDPSTERLGGGWLAVSRSYCAHCDDAHEPAVCRHKLAIWYADLLARHLPDDLERRQAERPEFTGGPDAQQAGARGVLGTAGGLGAATGGYIGRAHHARLTTAGDDRHCPRCGGWLTADGGCNKCGGNRHSGSAR